MEFCEGGSLDSVYREVKKLGGRTGEKVLGKIAEGVLEGLTYLSGRKIIHRGKSQGKLYNIIYYELMVTCRHQAFEHFVDAEWSSQAVRFWSVGGAYRI